MFFVMLRELGVNWRREEHVRYHATSAGQGVLEGELGRCRALLTRRTLTFARYSFFSFCEPLALKWRKLVQHAETCTTPGVPHESQAHVRSLLPRYFFCSWATNQELKHIFCLKAFRLEEQFLSPSGLLRVGP